MDIFPQYYLYTNNRSRIFLGTFNNNLYKNTHKIDKCVIYVGTISFIVLVN